MVFLSKSVEETKRLAAEFAGKLKRGETVALFGDVGAGKTHFVQGMAEKLCPGAHVTSPTFTIVNEYDGVLPLYHFDMYRIENFDQLYSTGFFDYLESGGVCVIEWSENVENVLPEERYEVTLERGAGETERKISIVRRENEINRKEW